MPAGSAARILACACACAYEFRGRAEANPPRKAMGPIRQGEMQKFRWPTSYEARLRTDQKLDPFQGRAAAFFTASMIARSSSPLSHTI
jgi:hypothetical protein